MLQNVNGERAVTYTFGRVGLQGGSKLSVWAGALMSPESVNALHRPRAGSIVWRDLVVWGSSSQCTTILAKPSGEALAWLHGAWLLEDTAGGGGVGAGTDVGMSAGAGECVGIFAGAGAGGQVEGQRWDRADEGKEGDRASGKDNGHKGAVPGEGEPLGIIEGIDEGEQYRAASEIGQALVGFDETEGMQDFERREKQQLITDEMGESSSENVDLTHSSTREKFLTHQMPPNELAIIADIEPVDSELMSPRAPMAPRGSLISDGDLFEGKIEGQGTGDACGGRESQKKQYYVEQGAPELQEERSVEKLETELGTAAPELDMVSAIRRKSESVTQPSSGKTGKPIVTTSTDGVKLDQATKKADFSIRKEKKTLAKSEESFFEEKKLNAVIRRGQLFYKADMKSCLQTGKAIGKQLIDLNSPEQNEWQLRSQNRPLLEAPQAPRAQGTTEFPTQGMQVSMHPTQESQGPKESQEVGLSFPGGHTGRKSSMRAARVSVDERKHLHVRISEVQPLPAPPSAFLSPKQRTARGLEQLQSTYNMSIFGAPMPRPREMSQF